MIFNMLGYISFDLSTRKWKDIASIVRTGAAPKTFPVGYEFVVPDAVTGMNNIWVVRGHNHHQVVSGAPYTMTLEMKNVYTDINGKSCVQYGAMQAFAYATTSFSGWCAFTVSGRSYGTADNGKEFYVKFEKTVPVGAQLVINADYSDLLGGKTISVYESPTSSEPIETAQIVSEWPENIQSSVMNYINGPTEFGPHVCEVNHINRALCGSNNYGQSAIRQWLNSENRAGSVWTPQTIFDRPPTSPLSEWDGFMRGLPDDFVEAAQVAVIPCRTNAYFEVPYIDGASMLQESAYNVQDKFFILSRPEVFGVYENNDVARGDGSLLEFYEAASQSERIKYDAVNIAQHTWQRTPTRWSVMYERIIHSNGSNGSDGSLANRFHAVAPVCVIA